MVKFHVSHRRDRLGIMRGGDVCSRRQTQAAVGLCGLPRDIPLSKVLLPHTEAHEPGIGLRPHSARPNTAELRPLASNEARRAGGRTSRESSA